MSIKTTKTKHISFVLPCYNEEASFDAMLAVLLAQHRILINSKKYTSSILFVDDGSSDNTLVKLQEAAKKHSFIYYVSLENNAGHQSALRAGIEAASRADALIMLDADLQHPPELAGKMLENWEAGYSIVQMVRKDSKDSASFVKRLTSNLYYRLLRLLSGIELESGASDFRLIDGALARGLAVSPEQKLFLRGYFATLPARRATIEYEAAERFAGTSKYTLRKMLSLAKSGVLQFSERPLYLSIILGLASALIGILYGIIIIYQHFFTQATVGGWSSIMVSLLFLFGINFVLIGVVGLYIGQSIRIQKSRPEYIIGQAHLPNEDH